MSTTAYGWNEMHLAVRPDRREPCILKNFAIDSDGETVLFEMRSERRVALAQCTQQLPDVLCVDFDFRIPTSELLQVAAQDQSRQGCSSTSLLGCLLGINRRQDTRW